MATDLYDDATVDRTQENRKCLVNVDSGLDSNDLVMLKFLYKDQLGVSKLEKIQSGIDLFSELEKLNVIGENNDSLAEALFRIHRLDLLKRIRYEPKVIRNHMKHNPTLLSPFRVVLFKVAEEVTSDEFKSMKFLLSDVIPRGKKLTTVFQLFNFLETDGQIMHDDCEVLLGVLNEIGRPELAQKIQDTYLTEPNNAQMLPGVIKHEQIQTVRPKCDENNLKTVPLPFEEHMDDSTGLGDMPLAVPAATQQAHGKITGLTDPILQQLGMDLSDQFDNLAPALGFRKQDLNFNSADYPHPGYKVYKLLMMWRDSKRAGKNEQENILELSSALDKIGCQYLAKLLRGSGTNQQVPNPQNVDATAAETGPDSTRSEEMMETSFQSVIPSRSKSLDPASSLQPQGSEQIQTKKIDILDTIQVVKSKESSSSENMVVSISEAQICKPHEVPTPNESTPNIAPSEPRIEQIPGQTASILPHIPEEVEIDLPSYKMDSNPRGYCIIINNKEFNSDNEDQDSRPMPIRNGTEVDRDNLKWVFEKMNFIVKVYDNLVDFQMVRVVNDVSINVDHTDFDCFVCCILSHGALGHVYGANGVLVRIEDMTSAFKSQKCPSLAGKPKLFFIQACQGREKQEGIEVYEEDSHTLDTDNAPIRTLIPDESDFLLGYATVPGYVSYRSRTHGSWYIQKLVEMLDKFQRKYDLMSIMVKVNEEVSRANANLEGGLFKQTPAPQVTLRKKIYFR